MYLQSLTNNFGFMVWVYVQLVHVGADFIGTDVTSSTVIYIGLTCDLVEFFTNILNLSVESRCCLNV